VNLEHELKQALKRQPPAPGMTERVMAAVNSRETAARAPSFWRARPGLRLTAAAVLIVAVGVGVARQREASRERLESELAARQLITALRIASEALNKATLGIKN
jgi:hypothetical protein